MSRYLAMARRQVRDLGWARAAGDLASELLFDVRYGIETWRPRGFWDRKIEGGVWEDLVQYQGANPRIVRKVLRAVGLDLVKAVFVDYGCGKGRVLVLAAEAGFRRLVGLEYVPEVAAICRMNLARAEPWMRRATVAIQQVDAADYVLPSEAAVAFLYNPFQGQTLRRVVERLRGHARKHPLLVAYVNPLGLAEFTVAGFQVVGRWECRGRLEAVTLRVRDGESLANSAPVGMCSRGQGGSG